MFNFFFKNSHIVGIKVLPDSAEESEGSDDGHWAKKESIPADYQQKMKLAESNLRDVRIFISIFLIKKYIII